jgi:hypothetical protein
MFPQKLFILLNKLLHINLAIRVLAALSQSNLEESLLLVLLEILSEVVVGVDALNAVISS